MVKYICIVFLVLLVLSTNVWSNDYLVKQYSIKEGLNQASVFSILKNHKWYMWLGTRNGLNRFDGYDFKKFYNFLGDSTSFTNNFIYSVCEDSFKRLRGETENRLGTYNSYNEKRCILSVLDAYGAS